MGDLNVDNLFNDIMDGEVIIGIDKKKIGKFFKRYIYIVYSKIYILRTRQEIIMEYNNYISIAELFNVKPEIIKQQVIANNGNINGKNQIIFKDKESIDSFDEYVDSLFMMMKMSD